VYFKVNMQSKEVWWRLLPVVFWTLHGFATLWVGSLSRQEKLPNTEVIASGVVVWEGQEYRHFRPCSSNPAYPGFERWTINFREINKANAQKLEPFQNYKRYMLVKFRGRVSAIPGYIFLGAFGYGHLSSFDREVDIEEILQTQDTNSAACPKARRKK
jgi:hypothetical protein